MANDFKGLDKPLMVCVRTVYGKELIYPENAAAKTLASLTRKTTLSIDDLKQARMLGLRVEFVSMGSAAQSIVEAH